MEFLDKCACREYEYESKHDRPENTVKQHSVIILLLHSEREEYHNHHENVVNGKGQLDQITGEILQGKLLVITVLILMPRKLSVIVHMMCLLGILLHEMILVMHVHYHISLQTDEQEEEQ